VPKMPIEIPGPLNCRPIKEAYEQEYLDPWIKEWGSTLDTVRLGPDSELFEIRPVDFAAYSGMDPKAQITLAWLRLASHLQGNNLKCAVIQFLLFLHIQFYCNESIKITPSFCWFKNQFSTMFEFKVSKFQMLKLIPCLYL
jgi:hypothetical protein